MSKGRRAITRELYDALLASFRDQPGPGWAACKVAAARALCAPNTAKRAWCGPPWKDYPWARPISLVLDEERLAAVARARELERARTQEAEKERERLRQAAIESRAQDERVLQLARADVLGALALAAELGKTVREVGLELTRRTTERDDQGRMKLATKDLLTLLTRHSQMMARAVAAAQVVLDLSRLDQGKPTAILGVQPAPQLSLEEAMMELQEAEVLLREAQEGRLQLPRAQHPRHGTTVVDAEVVA